jgi:hypothetical protein
MDGKHYCYIGRVIASHFSKWDAPEFNEAFDVTRLSDEIGEVTAILYDTYGITKPVRLHIITNYS